MQDTFYMRFENRFRGPEQQIKKQLQQYIPLLKALEKTSQPTALDIGCGRGEWLSVLTQRKWLIKGIDLNDDMVKHCQKKGLQAERHEALEYLKSLDAQSLNLITGFHIAEHVPFDTLQRIIREANRVLLPDGALLLETPNPENLQVGAHTFYMDPSHLHPLPPLLLQFIAQDQGFLQADIRRLNGAERPSNEMAFGDYLQWFFESNLDYALIAQKQKNLIPKKELNKIGEANSQYAEFYQVTRDYVEETHQRIEKTKQQQNKADLQQAEIKQQYKEIEQQQSEFLQIVQSLQARIDHLQEKADINEQKVQQLDERVIKIPRILQTIPRYYREFGAIETIKHSYYTGLEIVVMKVLSSAQLTQFSLKVLNKTPKFKAYLKNQLATEENTEKVVSYQQKSIQLESPRALKILQDIQQLTK